MTIEFKAALDWRAKGYNVVPQKAPEKKHPGVMWKDLQTRPVTDAELAQWQPKFANGVGFITGAISGTIVIETDGLAGETVLDEFEHEHGPLPETLIVSSGSMRGFHRHFKHPGGKVKTVANPAIQVDIKGDGGFCVLPPSLHRSGGRYEIVHDAEPADLPPGLLEFVEAAAERAKGKTLSPNIGCGRASSLRARGQVSGVVIGAILGNNLYDRLQVNRTNVAVIQSMLDALPAEYASEFDPWLRTGFALHDFDGGEIGLALWKWFSIRCAEKAAVTDFAARWAGLSRDYQGRRITLGWLRAKAQAHGWRAPCRWDRSTKIAS